MLPIVGAAIIQQQTIQMQNQALQAQHHAIQNQLHATTRRSNPSSTSDPWVRAMNAIEREAEGKEYDPNHEPLMLVAMRAQWEAEQRRDNADERQARIIMNARDQLHNTRLARHQESAPPPPTTTHDDSLILGIAIGAIATVLVWGFIAIAGVLPLIIILILSVPAAYLIGIIEKDLSH